MFLWLPQFLIFAIVLTSATAMQEEESTTTTSNTPETHYMFDRDAAGYDIKNAMNIQLAEDFRFYCFNQGQSFLNCASPCSLVLRLMNRLAFPKSPRCNFRYLTPQTATPDLTSAPILLREEYPKWKYWQVLNKHFAKAPCVTYHDSNIHPGN